MSVKNSTSSPANLLFGEIPLTSSLTLPFCTVRIKHSIKTCGNCLTRHNFTMLDIAISDESPNSCCDMGKEISNGDAVCFQGAALRLPAHGAPAVPSLAVPAAAAGKSRRRTRSDPLHWQLSSALPCLRLPKAWLGAHGWEAREARRRLDP